MPDDEPACRFLLPTPPSTNQLYANVPGKGRVKTARYKGWITAAGWEVKRQAPRFDYWGESLPAVRMLIEGAVGLDVDNLKAIPDLMQSMGVLSNDRIIEELTIRRAGGEPGKLVVSIWPM
jgi:Holliday junction resolvase RusA-like endonuclease